MKKNELRLFVLFEKTGHLLPVSIFISRLRGHVEVIPESGVEFQAGVRPRGRCRVLSLDGCESCNSDWIGQVDSVYGDGIDDFSYRRRVPVCCCSYLIHNERRWMQQLSDVVAR